MSNRTKTYTVDVTRTGYGHVDIEVEAGSRVEAAAKALKKARDSEFTEYESEYMVNSIAEMEDPADDVAEVKDGKHGCTVLPLFVVLQYLEGNLYEIHVFHNRQEAEDMEKCWLEEHGIRDDIARGDMAQKGTELRIWDSVLE